MSITISDNHEYTVDGLKVPSVTEILNVYFPPCGFYTEEGQQDGKYRHEWYAALAQGIETTNEPYPKIAPAIEGFKKFLADVKPEYVSGEIPYHHPTLRYCGTPDVVFRIGDKLDKVHINAKLWHLIINPGFKLATKDVYAAYDKRRLTTKGRGVRINCSFGRSSDYKSLEYMLYNDLEEIAIAKKKVLGNIIERLASHLGRKAIVSGSGPSVFCLCRTGKEGRTAKDKLFRSVPAARRKGWQVFVTRTET